MNPRFIETLKLQLNPLLFSASQGTKRIWAHCPEQVNHEQDWKPMADSHEQVWAPGMWGWTESFREIKWLGWKQIASFKLT